MTRVGARAHYTLGRVVPVLAAVSSSVSECQGGVKCIKTMMVAWFVKARRAGKQPRAKQERRRHLERVDKQVGTVHTRGHRVNFDIEPRISINSCLACSP